MVSRGPCGQYADWHEGELLKEKHPQTVATRRCPALFPFTPGTLVALPSGARNPKPQGRCPSPARSTRTCEASHWTHPKSPGEAQASPWAGGPGGNPTEVPVPYSPAKAATQSGHCPGWALGPPRYGGTTPSTRHPVSMASQVSTE